MKKYFLLFAISGFLNSAVVNNNTNQETKLIFDQICSNSKLNKIIDYKRNLKVTNNLIDNLFRFDKSVKFLNSTIIKCFEFLNQSVNKLDEDLNPKMYSQDMIRYNAASKMTSFQKPLDSKNIFNENYVLQKSFDNIINQISDRNIKIRIIHLFHQLKLLYGDQVINWSFNQINWSYLELESGGAHVRPNDNPYVICMELLGSEVFNLERMLFNYDIGDYSTSNILHIITHEYGHVLDIYTGLTLEQKQIINRHNEIIVCNGIYDESDVNLEKFNYYNFATRKLLQFIKNKFNIYNERTSLLFAQLLTQSIYAINSDDTEYETIRNNLAFNLEWFAESFSYWMLTDSEQRTYRWEILDSFFSEIFATILNEN